MIVDGKKIEEVVRYAYLGKMVTKDHGQVQEMKKENRKVMECIRYAEQHHAGQKICD